MEELKIGDIIKQRYMLVQFLGSGSFGEVWLAQDQMTGRDVALKIYISLDPAGVEEFQREYSNTADLSSPYLLTPEYFDVHNRRPFLVMKFCKNGSSSKLAGQISEEQIWSFIHDVVADLEVLHSQSTPIVHQDIKLYNILVDNNGRFLITDFGVSKRLRATMRCQSKRDVSSGAMPYMAPERFESNPKLTTASDTWSLGVSIDEFATGDLPISGFCEAMQKNGAGIPILEGYSESLNSIMQQCLAVSYEERTSASQLKNWVRNRSVPQIVGSATIKKERVAEATSSQIKPVLPVPTKSQRSNSENTNQDVLIEESNNETIEEQIINSTSFNLGGKICQFYSGVFHYGKDTYPVMVAFVQNGNRISKAVYKNKTYGSRIALSYHSSDSEITLVGKVGNNYFTIELSRGEGGSLVGTAKDGAKSMSVNLISASDTFDISNISEKRSENKYDITTIAKAFIKQYSDGVAPWSCLNSTSAKRLSNNIEEDRSTGGINMVPFSAPLTIGGKSIVANQLGEAENMDIYLREPNAGATSIMFSAMPQYVELEDVARKIGIALDTTYQSKRTSDYGRDCVLYYSLGILKMAICCSFEAHGGTIDVIIDNPNSVNEYANSYL